MKQKKIAVIQSNYIPWKGYFDIINMADEFVIYDDVQYTKNDWRNRNMIKTPNGLMWLTIPIHTKHSHCQRITDAMVSDYRWNKKHWHSIKINYAKAKYFKEYKDIFEEIYLNCEEKYLSQINHKFIKLINNILGIKTIISCSSDYDLCEGKLERLIQLCKILSASEYISGPSAKGYIDENLFLRENIKVTWMDYSGYPEYNQLFPPFEHNVSIIDLVFNEGTESTKYMKSFGEKRYD